MTVESLRFFARLFIPVFAAPDRENLAEVLLCYEFLYYRLIFLRFDAAGAVNQIAVGFHQGGAGRKDRILE